MANIAAFGGTVNGTATADTIIGIEANPGVLGPGGYPL